MSSLSGEGQNAGKPFASSVWQWGEKNAIVGCGERALMEAESSAFFSSRQCPGSAIRAATNWALVQAKSRHAVVSGFHSPLEQSVLKILMAAGSPAIVVLARPVSSARLAPEWRVSLERGQLAVVSQVNSSNRLSAKLAMARNDLVAQLAKEIVVAYASPGGTLMEQVKQWRLNGQNVDLLCAD